MFCDFYAFLVKKYSQIQLYVELNIQIFKKILSYFDVGISGLFRIEFFLFVVII